MIGESNVSEVSHCTYCGHRCHCYSSDCQECINDVCQTCECGNKKDDIQT
jgi:hypothetical protein